MSVRALLAMGLGLGVLLAAESAFGDGRELTVPVVERGPELGGDLSDPVWRQAARVADFVLMDTGERPEAATEALVLCDAEALYVGFTCEEPETDRLVTETSGHDGPVRTDDCVGLVLDPPNGDTWVYHALVNSRGVYWDALYAPAGLEAAGLSGITARGHVGEGRWTCELAVPFAGIGARPQPGETWGINFCRGRRAGTEELSSWVQAPAGFADATACGEARFAPEPGPVTVQVLSRGGVSADVADASLNAFAVRVRNAGPRPVGLRLEVLADGEPAAAEQAEVPAGASSDLRVSYAVPGEGRPVYTFAVHVDDRQVYRSELQAVRPIYRGPRTWSVPDPLFDELLSDRPPGLRREGTLIWGHLNDVSLLRETAKRFAIRYSEDEAYRIHAEHRLIFIGHGVVRDLEMDHPMARWRVRNAPAATRQYRGFPWVLGPAAIDASLSEIEDVFAGPHPLVFGVFAGDEVDDSALKQGSALMARPGDYEYIAQADADVRERFGDGRFGIPAGSVERDPDPYKWIAFRRWCNAVMRERNRRLCDIVRRHAPDMPIISVDGGGDLQPYEFSTQAELFDIFTYQHASRGDPWRCQLGYITKAIADLTGKEFWPCAHIEHYLVALTPAEVLEELSQIFRNGGSGLHLYMPDTGNARKMVGDTRTCYFGSPRRWHTVMNVVDLLRTMPRPEYPDYERTAILLNGDTLAAVPYDALRPYGEQTEACYTMLGPVARSWFRFIDCAQVMHRPDLAARFDIIYLPCARYQRPEVVARLREFVAHGGTLVCADPQAFETDIVGNDTAAERAELFGVTVGERLPVTGLAPADRDLGAGLPLTAEAYGLSPAEAVEVLASYDDGSAAVTCRRLGNGRAILFGSNPFSFTAVADASWREFFTAWTEWLGAPTGLPIWRFKLPDSLIWHEPAPPGLCLTGNHVLWQEEMPRVHLNHDTGGTYTCSPPPDAMPDAAGDGGAVALGDGHLTDRRQAIRARKTGHTRSAPYALPADRWMVSWETTQPVTIAFDLRRPYPLREFRLWFCDSLPDVTLAASADGREWHAAGGAEGREAGEDVLDVAVPLAAPGPCRHLRVTFAARAPGQRLTLVEAEVWGDVPGA